MTRSQNLNDAVNSETSVRYMLKDFKDEVKRRLKKNNNLVRKFKRAIKNYRDAHQKSLKIWHQELKKKNVPIAAPSPTPSPSPSSNEVDFKERISVCSVLSDNTGQDSLDDSSSSDSESVNIQKKVNLEKPKDKMKAAPRKRGRPRKKSVPFWKKKS
ncbi:uncharacterized protein LOC119681064 [Teleopsis dalmanni]|uniref:uncharacterized protein LOC119681064 n=1 Tax=Teleopsis dalmanni TaxID=139649 RepID=UPI0018CF4D37|nr:uncharacterized protein LOC119681064 [Teleopsis dalmanni]XP_037950062.1 uncharacterized protein LOC119681064 [Teleopsis dalmanni]